ncbi:excinuclease ABC subunit C [Paenibacillus sp. UNCCL117]|uniref:GIY-YIG nuclease family protein n=1 Tax=unclassified Paenibacillus TaxID=185978 RepID=UPI00087FD970|nr:MULTISPECIES: GIY-YIG nuclease family protein [unclassified Paenibacillus]SDD48701.1 excinuclease ABC subunit C [Paenibacillus sp. cl123]SFW50186.1 excinuclease ABC subunit C [Paenibacillus sp. UNCCL117]
MPFVFQAHEYPLSPGCYLMKNDSGRILYVGKSKCLRNRLRSYFRQTHAEKRIRQLVAEIASIEVVLVNNESESLLLENNLIKIHKPPYNRALKKDNSGYAYLQLTSERLPRLEVYYRNRSSRLPPPAQDGLAGKKAASGAGIQRLGPFKSSRFRDALLEFVTDHYGLRTCTVLPKKVCLLYHIGKCSGVCEGLISEEEYRERVRQAAGLLAHQGEALIGAMSERMTWYAERLEFEKAQNMLSHIRNLQKVPDKQIVDREGELDQDVLYFGESGVMVAKVQQGMLRDFQLYELTAGWQETACDRFLVERYADNPPHELIVNQVGDPGFVKSSLRRRGVRRSPVITRPKRGLKYDLLLLCKQNYEYRMSRAARNEDEQG